MIKVLNDGYIRLIETSGSDLTIVNSARASFNKSSDVLEMRDKKLIEYLVKHRHDSCLRHCSMTFEFRAPLMIARQHWKHHVASTFVDNANGWNEQSQRYVTQDFTFYVPDGFSAAPSNKKQGAGDPIDEETNAYWRKKLMRHQADGLYYYNQALDAGIAPEQARLLLPAYGLYVNYYWTTSLNAVMNFLDLRLDSHAQSEIRSYAEAVETFVAEKFPVTYGAWKDHRE